MVQPLWKVMWRFLKKLKVELPYHPAIPLLGIYLKKPKTLMLKKISTPVFIAVLVTSCGSSPCPAIDEWIKQLWDIYTMEYYLAVKNRKIRPF